MPHRRRPQTFVDHAIAASINRPVSPVGGYVIATIAVVATATIRALFVTALLPWLLYVPVVLGCALVLGARPAAWALLLSAAIAATTIYVPGEAFLLSGPQWGASLVFLMVGGLVIIVGQQLRMAFARADALAVEYERALQVAEETRDQLAEREGFLSGILSSSSDCIKVLDLEGRLRFMSDGGQQVMEVIDFGSIDGCPWASFWEGSGKASAQEAVAAAQAGKSHNFTNQAPTMAGNMRWWDVAVSPILGADGKPERILSVSRDVTASRAADDQVKLLNAELGHRLKNTLALVQAITSQTLKDGSDLSSARETLIDRLVALGHGADILTASSWDAAEIGSLARSVLAAQPLERIAINGPQIRLSSRLALSLSLALHELATNAVKYGALSNETGQVHLNWDLFSAGEPETVRMRLTWTETGGPEVAQPERKGFGSLLIGRALASNFKGTSTIDYNPAGIVFTLDAPLAALNEIEHG